MIKGEKNISVLNVIYYIIYYIDMNNIAVCWRDCFGLVGLKPNTSINIKQEAVMTDYYWAFVYVAFRHFKDYLYLGFTEQSLYSCDI